MSLQANGDITVNQFKFENGRMGTLDAHVNWNTEKEQIDIHAIADDGKEAMTYIDGYVSPTKNYIDLASRRMAPISTSCSPSPRASSAR